MLVGRNTGIAFLAAWAAILTPSCRSPGDSVVAPSPGPGPTPTPTPTSTPARTFAYVLDPAASTLIAFEADSATGQLRLVEEHGESEARLLAADPGGRFLYLAGGDARGAVRSYLRSYSVEAATGLLTRRSQHTWDSLLRPPLSLAASARRVYVVGGRPFTGTHGGWVAFDVDSATGLLTEAPRPPGRFEPDFVVTNAEGRIVYTAALDPSNSYSSTLFASALQPDGTLKDVGSTVPDAQPSAAVLGRGFLIVADSAGGITTFAVGESGLLSPRARLPSALGRGAARVAQDASGLLAASGSAQLLVYAVGADGELSLRDEVALSSANPPRHVAFHPSGRYLYTSGAGEGVRTFAIAADSRLQEVGRVPQGGGPIVLVGPPAGGG